MKQKNHAAGAFEPSRPSPWTSPVLARFGDLGRFINNISAHVVRPVFLAFLGLCAVATGCSRSEFAVPLNSTEAIKEGDAVELAETGTKIGRCTKIDGAGPSKVALIVINHSARVTLRAGAERVAAGQLVLANGPETAPPLPSGSVIKTRTPIEQIAKGSLGAISGTWNAVADYACDHPLIAIIGGICALLIAFALIRTLSGRAVMLLLLLATLAAIAPRVHAAVKSGDVDKSLVTIEAILDTAGREAASADHYDQAAAPALFESAAVRAVFALDRAILLTANTRGDLAKLSIWTTEETARTLRDRFDRANARSASLEAQLVRLSTAPNTRRDALPRLYLLEREFIRARIRDGLTDPAVIIQELAALGHLPLSLVEASVITLENAPRVQVRENGIRLPDGSVFSLDSAEERQRVATQLSTAQEKLESLERANFELRAKVSAIQSTPPVSAPNSSLVFWLTPPEATMRATEPREVKSPQDSESPQARSESPDVIAAPNATLSHAGNASLHADANQGDAIAAKNSLSTEQDSSPPGAADGSGSWLSAHRITAGIAAAALCLLGIIAVLLLRPDSGLSISIADQRDRAAEFEVPAGAAVVLSATPFVDLSDGVEEQPKIEATRGAAVLVPRHEGVELNGEKITSPQKLSPGDRISISATDGPRCFRFLSAERLSSTATA